MPKVFIKHLISHYEILILRIDKILLRQNWVSQCKTLSDFSGYFFRCCIVACAFDLFIEKIWTQNLCFPFWKPYLFLTSLNGLVMILSWKSRIKINFIRLVNRWVRMMVFPWKRKSYILVFRLGYFQIIFPIWTLFDCRLVLKRIIRFFLHFKIWN